MKKYVACDMEVTMETLHAFGLCRYALYLLTDGNGHWIKDYDEARLIGAYKRLRLIKRKEKTALPSVYNLYLMAKSPLDDARDAALAVLAGCLDDDSLLFLVWSYRDWVRAGRPVMPRVA